MAHYVRDSVVEKKLVKPAQRRRVDREKITGTENWTTLGESAESVIANILQRIGPPRR